MKPTKSTRINAFDLLRGWCLVVIASDHLMLFPSLFDPVTGRGLLWVSAAEGFFFISGALVGMVRGRQMHKESLMASARAAWKRAGQLYIASMVLTLLFTAMTYLLENKGVAFLKGGVEHFGSVWELLFKTLTLQYSYGWTDFLNYYVVFLILSPLALWVCKKGLWWAVALASLILWVLNLAVPDVILSSYLTWQAYFFFGIIFGYHYGTIHQAWRGLQDTTRQWIVRVAVGVTAVTLLASFAFTFGNQIFEGVNAVLYEFFRNVKDNQVFTALLQENRTGVLRLPIFALWFGTLFWLVRRYESAIIDKVGWLLLPMGKNSLYVYIMQGLVVSLVSLVWWPDSFWLNTLINIVLIGILWLTVRRKFLFRIIPR